MLELDSGRSSIVATDAHQVAFAGSSMIVRLAGGQVQVRSASDGRLQRQTDALPRSQPFDKPTTNGQTIADVTTDGTIRLVDVDGSAIGSIPLDPDFENRKTGLVFAPDGATLVIAAPGRTVQRLSAAPAQWTTTACALAGRVLTSDEWLAAGARGTPDPNCAP